MKGQRVGLHASFEPVCSPVIVSQISIRRRFVQGISGPWSCLDRGACAKFSSFDWCCTLGEPVLYHTNVCGTVLVAMPTVMCRLAEFLVEKNEPAHSVRLLLYIGELLHKDQKVLLRRAFPSLKSDRSNTALSTAGLLDCLSILRVVKMTTIQRCMRSVGVPWSWS